LAIREHFDMRWLIVIDGSFYIIMGIVFFFETVTDDTDVSITFDV